MIPIVSIVGWSGSGKTTLIEKLIAELTGRGWRVATLKHNREGFAVDREGKDSWRHRRAGAVTTVLASPAEVVVIEDAPRDYSLAEAAGRFIRDADLVLAEGYKGNPHPKIEVLGGDGNRERLCRPGDDLIALAGDQPVASETPFFHRDAAAGIADLIEARFLPPRAER